MVLLIDNYDSFSFNLYQLVGSIDPDIKVIRSDELTVEEIRSLKPDYVILSPGPGRPADAGVYEDLLRECKGEFPILGVCLGHQAIGEVFGGCIVRANEIIHGKASPIHHCATGIYHGIADGTLVARYHSLIIERESLPNTLEITSELDNGIIMGVRHHVFPIEGIQFHPESILTPDGQTMMINYLKGIHAI